MATSAPRTTERAARGSDTSPADRRYAPNYAIAEAARYLRIPAATIRWWCLGQTYRTAEGPRRARPVISIPSGTRPALSFVNLVELHVLDAIRHEHRVSLPEIRKAVRYLAEQFGARHPLAEERFETNGIDLFVERDTEVALAPLLADGRLEAPRAAGDRAPPAAASSPWPSSTYRT